ncbi:sulfurtransferase TusA family protein [Algihabitans sp.]|uniref:sulfurtransferase TusA family protein n=1 Tax=Algihabitans sp. TaxID=2821514 RepID=UPI003BA8C36F
MSDQAPQNDLTLDAKGMKCPLPVLRARKAMKDVPPGGTLEVLATDPSAPEDFVNFCETTGHELLENRQDGDLFVLRIRKAG